MNRNMNLRDIETEVADLANMTEELADRIRVVQSYFAVLLGVQPDPKPDTLEPDEPEGPQGNSRRTNQLSLHEDIHSLLKERGGAMSYPEIAEELISRGRKTASKNFRSTCNVCVRNHPDLFKVNADPSRVQRKLVSAK